LTEPLSQFAYTIRQTLAGIRGYTPQTARRDTLAGLSVAVIAIPQSMAYALIANVPAQYGLYTLIIHCLMGAVLNSTRFMSVGPVNTQSLMVASVVTHIVNLGGPVEGLPREQMFIELVLGLTLVKGLIQIALASARMGMLVKYVSQSVIVGFTAGAGVLIAVGQVPFFLGMDIADTPRKLPGALGVFERVFANLDLINHLSVILGSVSLVALILMRRLNKRLPGPLVMVVITAGIVYFNKWTPDDLLLIAPLPEQLPGLSVPDLSLAQFERLLGGALALSLLGVLETYSIGKAIAGRTGERVDANTELASQGVIHLASGFLACIPGSGSFSRSALNVYAGAATRFSGAVCGLVVLLALLFFAPQARYIPLSCLAAILFIVAFALIDWRYMRFILRTDKADSIVCYGTFIATLTVPLQYAIFLGVFLSLSAYLRQASRLNLIVRQPREDGDFDELRLDHSAEPENYNRDIVFLQFEGGLFFGVADELSDRLNEIAASEARVVIFRLKRTGFIDTTVLRVLERFVDDMHARGGAIVLCGVRPDMMKRLKAFGLIEQIGEGNTFGTLPGVFVSARQAIDRAEEILNLKTNNEGVDGSV
jgi:SulP family sulfate permease